MLINTLKTIFKRDLTRLNTELGLYREEKRIWQIETGITNSAGNLCLHITGNLNTYIGSVLGNSGYIRNRELEFTLKDIPRHELIKKINDTIVIIDQVLDTLTEDDLKNAYPILVLEQKTSTEFFLTHLTTHLSYHLGQVNYHRRLLDI